MLGLKERAPEKIDLEQLSVKIVHVINRIAMGFA